MTGLNEATMELRKRGISAVTHKSKVLPYLICGLAAMFYLYEFVLQVSPSVMTTELMRDLHLNAAGLGTVAAFYYYAYTPMQLPAGLLYDRYGPRLLISLALLICATGAFFFGLTDTAALASAGRFFMGIGSAFSFIGALLLISRWFPAKYFALLAGLVQLMSSIGAITGQVPLAAAVTTWGWRHTMLWTSMFGVIIAALVWLIVRNSPEEANGQLKSRKVVQGGELRRLREICASRQTWIVGIYSFMSWAPITAFAALWGIPFMVANYGMTTQSASTACAMIWMGIGIGSPLAGWWSDRIGSRCKPLTYCGLIGAVSISFIIYVSSLPLPLMYMLLFFFGIAASGQSLAFAVVKDNNHPRVVGSAIGFNNMATVAGGALFQPLVGILLHWHWSGATQGGAPLYSVSDYRVALAVVPLCYLGAFLMSKLLIRETHCTDQYKRT